jgi:ribonuclease Y
MSTELSVLNLILAFGFGGLFGGSVYQALSIWSARARLALAKEEAESLLAQAREEAELTIDEGQLSAKEIEDSVWEKADKDLKQIEARVRALDEETRKRRSTGDRDHHFETTDATKLSQHAREKEAKLAQRESRFQTLKAQALDLTAKLHLELEARSGATKEDLSSKVSAELDHQFLLRAREKAGEVEAEMRAEAEIRAKRILDLAYSRFQRPAPTERGVGVVEIPNEDVKRRMLGPDGINIRTVADLCGVELNLTEANTFQVASFDPTKREVTTRLLERLVHEKAPNPETVRRLFDKVTKDVARKIESDGQRVAAELGQKDLHPEIKRMLGVLRYRYSFAQNQHFHVAEVGWLCGLLASEVGAADVSSARRAGLLHDVGKAMDHDQDGGHAVIGADFIKARNEKDPIVHAVRSHHFEETPSSDLAFLVIAADAISGARPGARRQTVSIYNQKIETLVAIADSFPGVHRTLIFNAGREVRVLVDSRRVSDRQALQLAQDITRRIEAECTYPGSIKVMVVRETQAEAIAR